MPEGSLTIREVREWQEQGFLVLPQFLDESELASIEAAVKLAWLERPLDLTVDAMGTHRRVSIRYVTDEERRAPYKLNDLYLIDEELRAVVNSPRLGRLLGELLGDSPVIINSLTVEYGTEQLDHVDTHFMTPSSRDGLVATWIALEDVAPDAGPLRYWPGSHLIEPFRFSDPGPGALHLHAVQSEMPAWREYIERQIEQLGLKERVLLARRGDVLVWHGLLLHGGLPIQRPGSTRRSLITHYWRRNDCERAGCDLQPAPGGLWWRRQPQPQPDNPVDRQDG